MSGFRLVDLWRTKTGLSLAESLWRNTYKKSESDVAVRKTVVRGLVGEYWDSHLPLSDSNHTFARDMQFLARWAHFGFGHLTTSHKFAAALMSSEIPPDVVSDIHIPWRSFVVSVPPGLLVDDEGLDFNTLHVSLNLKMSDALPERFTLEMASLAPGMRCGVQCIWESRNSALAFFTPEDPRPRGSDAETGRRDRIAVLAHRLVGGLLCHLSSENLNGGVGGGVSRRHGPPKHRVTFVGRPISVDCRRGVASYLRGDIGTPSSVQTLVRGHYKRQACGFASRERKVIWIEPYWRGPEDAPILARPYCVEAAAC